MKTKTLLILLIIFSSLITQAQNEANIWYFGTYSGFDFNSGQPVFMHDIPYSSMNANASMCDSSGNLLFACNGRKIWNRDGQIMQNGDGIIGKSFASQGALMLQKPGSNHLYYVFTLGKSNELLGMYYSVVDLSLDGGLGSVTSEKNIPLNAGWEAMEKMTSVRHANGKDIWVITRKFREDSYAAFLLTSSGINNEPVFFHQYQSPNHQSQITNHQSPIANHQSPITNHHSSLIFPTFAQKKMTLIKSISGIRGTIGGTTGENLTPVDIVKFTAAFAGIMQIKNPGKRLHFVVGRDARISGKMVEQLVNATLCGMGIDVINAGLSTTPTVEMAVIETQSDGGIILTASHNPKQWNALKLLNGKGEFISAKEGEQVLELAESENFSFAVVDELGTITNDDSFIERHIEKILQLELVNKEIIAAANFKVAVDAVNSTGGISIPPLLKALGVKEVVELYCEPNGQFPHNPEPLPENLTEVSRIVKESKADLGFVVDPDVDRLVIVMENGEMFGEEYTLVAVADYILAHKKGNTASNLSSTQALRDITEKAGGRYFASAVGEVNVVEKMKEVGAVIGGEGNGGIIYPELHYGRDALVGIALFLTLLAKKKMKVSELRKTYPDYFISKNKVQLDEGTGIQQLFEKIKAHFSQFPVLTIDGVKIEFPDGWVHLRPSNTEPVLRIYAESTSMEKAQKYAQEVMGLIGG